MDKDLADFARLRQEAHKEAHNLLQTSKRLLAEATQLIARAREIQAAAKLAPPPVDSI